MDRLSSERWTDCLRSKDEHDGISDYTSSQIRESYKENSCSQVWRTIRWQFSYFSAKESRGDEEKEKKGIVLFINL